MFKYIAALVLANLESWINKLTDEKAKEYAAKINAQVDVPLLDENQEDEIIYNTLKNAVIIVRALLKIVKI